MWCLETIKQINQKHAEMGRDGAPVDARQVYVECGIAVLGSASKPKHDGDTAQEDEQTFEDTAPPFYCDKTAELLVELHSDANRRARKEILD